MHTPTHSGRHITLSIFTAVAILLASLALPATSSSASASDKVYADRSDTRSGDPYRDPGPGPEWVEAVVLHDGSPATTTTSGGSGVWAAGPASCAFECIDRAWLSTALSTTALTLDVETNVDATISYAVATHAPYLGLDGVPYFPVTAVADDTAGETDDWTTVIDGLAADTDYHIIVIATDDAGTHSVTGTFRTITPATQGIGTYANEVDAGCSFSCIDSVAIIPGEGDTAEAVESVEVAVTTDRPAHIHVVFATELEVWSDGLATYDSIITSVGGPTSANAWQGTATGLSADETFRVAVFAVDEFGGTDVHVQWVTLEPYPTVDLVYVPLRTRVHESGDAVGAGELRFAWRVGDPYNPVHTDSRSRQKIDDGESFWFATHNQYTLHNVAVNEVLPDFVITGFEHDQDLQGEFDTVGISPFIDPHAGYIDSADEAYNTAQLRNWTWNGFDQAPVVGDLDGLATCGSFPEIGAGHVFADSPCVKIETHPAGGPGGEEYPHFWTILAIHPVANA